MKIIAKPIDIPVRLCNNNHVSNQTAEEIKKMWTASTRNDEGVTEVDVIEDQSNMLHIADDKREEIGVAILERVAAEHSGPADCLAFWLTVDEAAWPVSDDVDTWQFEQAHAAWSEFIKTGYSGTDWFRCMYAPVGDEQADAD